MKEQQDRQNSLFHPVHKADDDQFILKQTHKAPLMTFLWISSGQKMVDYTLQDYLRNQLFFFFKIDWSKNLKEIPTVIVEEIVKRYNGPIFLQTIPIPVQAQKNWAWTGIIFDFVFQDHLKGNFLNSQQPMIVC